MIGACSAYLRKQLDMINCVDVITLAETYALPRLRRFAYNYISENFMNLTSQQMNLLTLEQVNTSIKPREYVLMLYIVQGLLKRFLCPVFLIDLLTYSYENIFQIFFFQVHTKK